MAAPAITRHRIEIVPANRLMNAAQVLQQNLTLLELVPQLVNIEGCLQFLAERALIGNSWTCDVCQERGRLQATEAIDGFVWRCPPPCRRRKSIRQGSFFSKSHLDLKKIIMFIYLWAADLPLKFIQAEVGCDDKTATKWANFLRDVCSEAIIVNMRQRTVGLVHCCLEMP
eukprot:XP_785036.1 PREDICTED: uncharacterized protein LOC579849 isoform X2 [Strongylocentrotus purpuratus]